MSKERFGDPVRFPRRGAAVVAEHEGVRRRVSAAFGGQVDEQVDGCRIEIDDVTAFGLGGSQDRSVGSFHPTGTERHPTCGEVQVVPAQTEQLGAASTAARGQHEQGVEWLVTLGDVVEQDAQLGRCRRS